MALVYNERTGEFEEKGSSGRTSNRTTGRSSGGSSRRTPASGSGSSNRRSPSQWWRIKILLKRLLTIAFVVGCLWMCYEYLPGLLGISGNDNQEIAELKMSIEQHIQAADVDHIEELEEACDDLQELKQNQSFFNRTTHDSYEREIREKGRAIQEDIQSAPTAVRNLPVNQRKIQQITEILESL